MHPGIELRISTPAGVVVQCDSDFAHYSTTFRGVPPGQWITLLQHFEGQAVLDEGQAAVVEGAAAPLLKVELRAIELEDADVPDDARELLDELAEVGADELAEYAASVGADESPGFDRGPVVCEPCRHMCAGTLPVCCVCGSSAVTYWNFRDQPFCTRCANGEEPASSWWRRALRWPWSRGDR